jgi:hypothetical protein
MKGKFLKIAFLIIFLSGIIVFVMHNVSKKLTISDNAVISNLTDSLNIDHELLHQNYDYQIKAIEKIQEQVLHQIEPSSTGIPFGEKREPENVIKIGEGQCFDRSRLLEKIFIFYDLKTRHLSIFHHPKFHAFIKVITSRSVASHATTEVRTLKGWLIVDSNNKWISKNLKGEAVSFKNIEGQQWMVEPDASLAPFYTNKSTVVYGIYSRHGQFYPPFNKIPDYNIRELFYNFGF